ncbi:C40 family peptidase [Leeia sp. TBRC 13508]|uniref:C40 family peptidase n=1 Tax=Leeia speluncae TaxID=2884804 RepID=A0ABS8D3W2_9NEIS|nr:NlpC/P60 family protein [Leeia speluncae]MCB6182890.1 C40 family peptidase [Leeia speluncae]
MSYESARYAALKQMEDVVGYVYLDTKGYPTIGAGINLCNGKNGAFNEERWAKVEEAIGYPLPKLKADLQQVGHVLQHTPDGSHPKFKDFEASSRGKAIGEITSLKLDKSGHSYVFASPEWQKQLTLTDAQSKALVDQFAPEYEAKLNKNLAKAGVEVSALSDAQKAVMFSMVWHNPSASEKLAHAVKQYQTNHSEKELKQAFDAIGHKAGSGFDKRYHDSAEIFLGHKHLSSVEEIAGQSKQPSQLADPVLHHQRSILDYATRNFSSKTHEYGREDMAGELVKNGQGNKFDGTRYNQDRDGDGRKGVDCSALVYYAMKGAGYNIEEKFPTHKDGSFGFTTHALFEGKHLTSYAEKHFDRVGSKEDLQPGDLVMFKTGKTSQHIGIYAGKDANGHPQFFGSQSSTGPALARLDADPWNKEYLGAIRPKDEFRQPGLREIVEIKPSLDPRAAAEKTPNDRAFAASPFLPERQYSLPDYLKGLYDQVAKYTSDYLHGMTDDQKRNVMTCMATQANEMKASKLDYVHQAKDGQLYHQWDEFKDARVDPHQVKEIPAASQVATLQQSEQARTLQESQQKQQGHRVMEV